MCASHESVHPPPPPPLIVLAASISFTLSEFSSRESEMDGVAFGKLCSQKSLGFLVGFRPKRSHSFLGDGLVPPLACTSWKCRNRRKRLRGSTRFVQRQGANRRAGGDGAKRSNRTVKCGRGGGGGWEGGEHACKVGEEE